MKKMVRNLLWMILSANLVFAQYPGWKQYTNGDFIHSLADDGTSLWIGNDGGLVQLNKETGETTFYNSANSPIPDNDRLNAITIATDNSIWFGVYGALVHKDGESWEVFNTPGYTMNALTFDKNGVLWTGFRNKGLASFDGSSWTTFKAATSDLPDDHITSLAVDSHNNVWIGTDADGLAKFDGDSTWQVFQTSTSDLPSNKIRGIEVDSSDHLWLATYGYGLVFYNDTTFTKYTSSNSDLPTSYLTAVDRYANGNLLIGTRYGAVHYDLSEMAVYDSLPADYVYSVAAGTAGEHWIGTSNGLVKIDDNGQHEYHPSNSSLPDNYINTLKKDAAGNIWFATDDGIAIRKTDGSWFTFTEENSPISNYEIHDLAFDNSGKVWIATSYGLFEHNPADSIWKQYKESNSDIYSDYIGSVTVNESGHVWLGTRENNEIISFIDSVWTTYKATDTGIDYWYYINDLEFDSSGVLWCATKGAGIRVFDGNSWESFTTSDDLPSNYVQTVTVDKANTLWFGFEDYGIAHYDRTNWNFINPNSSGLLDWDVTSIILDSKGRWWIGGEDGLSCNDDGIWSTYEYDNSGLQDYYISSVLEDNDGLIWMGTESSGAARFDPSTMVGINANKVKQIPDDFVLQQNFPNPFNPSTVIGYRLPVRSNIELSVFNALGQRVQTLVKQEQSAGNYAINFEAKKLASGIYYYKLIIGSGQTQMKKMVLIK